MDALATFADDCSGADEFQRQTSIAGNEGSNHARRGGHNWGISPNISRASVAREKKPPAPAPAPALPAVPTVEAPQARSVVGRLIESYPEIIEALRDRTEFMDISRLELDRISGLAEGHSSHLLARKYMQRLGPVSLKLLLDTLGLQLLRVENFELAGPNSAGPKSLERLFSDASGLRLVIVEDPQATARTLKQRTPRQANHPGRVPRLLAAPALD